jgi:hypothetical protein
MGHRKGLKKMKIRTFGLYFGGNKPFNPNFWFVNTQLYEIPNPAFEKVRYLIDEKVIQ